MKKISEMTLEELQDYALSLEEMQRKFEDDEKAFKERVKELEGLNTTLQKRNNDLFLKVEQQTTGTPEGTPDPVPVESCEDFARKLKI